MSAPPVDTETGSVPAGHIRLTGPQVRGVSAGQMESPKKRTPHSITFTRVGSKVAQRLKKLDADGNGEIDVNELTGAVQELIAQETQNKTLWYVLIAAFVVMVLMIGTLTGMTYGIVKLSQPTKVSNNQFLVTRDGNPALTGGAVLDLTGAAPNTLQATAVLSAVNATGRRRLLQSSSSNNPLLIVNNVTGSALTYLTSVSADTVTQACQFIQQGLSSFFGMGQSSILSGGSSMYTLTVNEQAGCNGDDTDVNTVSAQLTLTKTNYPTLHIEVYCANNVCTAWYDQAYNRNIFQTSTPPNTTSNSTSGRRLQSANGATRTGRQLMQANLNQCNHVGSIATGVLTGVAATAALAVGTELTDGAASYVAETVAPLVATGGDTAIAIALDGGCCFACNVGWIVDGNCGCKQVASCFPSHATVEVLGRGLVPMDALNYGDKVASIEYGTGRRVFREVYLFGHKDSNMVQEYINVKTAAGTLQLSPKHYIPACTADCDSPSPIMQYKYGRDVVVGDLVYVATATGAELAAVEEVAISLERGAFNPYIRGADLVVNGMVASSHSDWVFDDVTPAAYRHLLPTVYNVLLYPIYMFYSAVGPKNAEWVAHSGLALAEPTSTQGLGQYAFSGYTVITALVITAVASPAAAVGWSLAKKGRRIVQA